MRVRAGRGAPRELLMLGEARRTKREEDGMTEDREVVPFYPEEEALKLLGEAFNAFALLPTLHPADLPEFVHHIHACQNIILSRVGLKILKDRVK